MNCRKHMLFLLRKLMHDFRCPDPDNMYYSIMSDSARYYKENLEGVSEMCREMEILRNEGKNEGLDIFAALVKKLTELGRLEDITRAAFDNVYRDKLISEFVIYKTGIDISHR